MKRIGLLSDTHGIWDDDMMKFFADCDEIWHAGDIGSIELADKIADFKPLRAVYGNIDDSKVRIVYPKFLSFQVEEMRVLMMHIGGTPNNYEEEAKRLIEQYPSDIFVCGHSHILRVKFDRKNSFMYLNPGASGNFGPHHVRTAIRFGIDGSKMVDMEVWEKKKQAGTL